MSSKVFVAGVGMTDFIKPRGLVEYEQMGCEAIVKALLDAGLTYDSVQYAIAGYVYGDSCCGQRVLYQLGMTGIPIMNVNNNCSTGSSAVYQAKRLIESGDADCVLCVGFEKMEPGSLGSKFTDRALPIGLFGAMMAETKGLSNSPIACQLFANAGIEYLDKYAKGDYSSLAKIAQINHKHSANNPYSQFRDVYTLDQIKASPKIFGPVAKLECCPTSDGAAATILISEKFLNAHPNLKNQAIEIAAMAMTTDMASTFNRTSLDLIGYQMDKQAADIVFSKARLTPDDIQVAEVHDCFSANELIVLDALGLAKPGHAQDLVNNGDITYGGKYVVNPSGGLISKGHPLGATGIAQLSELVWHLRGWATNRSVPNTKACLQHNIGLGGACIVAIYKRPDNTFAPTSLDNSIIDGRARVGYNPAVESRRITLKDLRKVQSKNHSDFAMQTLEFEQSGSHL